MTTDEYISSLRSKEIIISVQDERIAIKAPDGALTPEIIKDLTAKKQEVLDFFNSLKKANKFKSIPSAGNRDYYPLSSAQRRMYFLYEFDKLGTGYNMPGFYKISGNLNIDRLTATFKSLLDRHQSLRTCFEIVAGEPVQRILDIEDFSIDRLSGSISEIDNIVKAFVQPFNLSEEFPFRVSLVDFNDKDFLLMVDMHHIVNDGVSQEIWMRDFWSLYQGEKLPPLTLQYTDYAVWQQSKEHQKIVAEHKKYWLETFSEEITQIELPTDYNRSSDINNEGSNYSIKLDQKTSKALKALAKSNGVTLYTLFLSIYTILLSKLANEEDIVIGTPTAGRQHADLDGVVGMFVNTLALRNHVNGEFGFQDFLAAVQENTLAAFDHQSYQYEELVHTLGLSNDTSRNPLFDHFFSYREQPKEMGFSDVNITISNYETSYNIAKFDLELDFLEKGEEFEVLFTYNCSLFTENTIQKFSEYLKKIVNAIVLHANIKLSHINILSKKEQIKLLEEFNNTTKNYDLESTVLDMFIGWSKTSPDAKAVVFGKQKLSYEELHIKSSQWAMSLKRLAVVPGTIVGMMMDRSVEMIVAILAIMKSGAAYLPMNPNQPAERTLQMLEEGEVSIVLTNISSIPDELQDSYVFLNAAHLDSENIPKDFDKSSYPSPKELAYIIYTSGSTGQPKGVMIQHESLSNLIQHQKELFDMSNNERVLMFSPYYFDASIEQLWLALSQGGTLVLVTEEMLLESNKLNLYLREEKVTHLDSTPSFLERIDIEDLPALQRVVSGGEVCKNTLALKISRKYPLYNVYGPTEVTVTSTVHRIDESYNIADKVFIGRPIGNTQVYVLNEALELLPLGVKGELYLGGKGLSSGYLKRPDLTEERFVKNPFGSGKLYKTGDLVCWSSDGRLEYLGRNDHQVKIRGIRMELGEISLQLEHIEQIEQALVTAHGLEDNKQLVAYLSGDESLSNEEIKLLLSSKLPDYMVPVHYIWLKYFPLTPNGKVDLKALPIPDMTLGIEYVAPENVVQEKLVTIWSEILGLDIEKISIISDFFNLGGHSLAAITLMNNIEKTFSVNISLRDLFVHRTIREFSSYISQMDQINFVSIPSAGNRDYYPLSSAQRRMYFLYEFDKLGTGYNMPGFYKISGNLNIDRLTATFKSLLDRHQSLRTCFEIVAGEPVQRILDIEDFSIDRLSGSISEIDNIVKAFVQPFNLSEEFPFRVSLVDFNDKDFLLMVDMHHIVNDGVSQEIWMRDFWSLYQGEKLPPLTLQYTDYAVWQQSKEHQKIVAEHKKYWLETFSEEITSLNLPLDYVRPLEKKYNGNTYSITLAQSQSDELRAFAKAEGVTIYVLFLSIYNILIQKLSNHEDIIVGTSTAGRNHIDLESLVGMFVNTLPLRNHVDGELRFHDFLAAVQDKTLSAFDHQLYQYEELVDALGVPRNISRNPLFDVFFSYKNATRDIDFSNTNISIEAHDVPYDMAKFDLQLDVTDHGTTFDIGFEYSTSLFDEVTIKRFFAYMQKIMISILTNSKVKLSEIEVLSDREQEHLLVDFNDTAVVYKADMTVLDMFNEQVLLKPNSRALIFGDQTLTYKDLDTRSDLWASNLLNLGVTTGSVLGLMTTRSLEMIIAILAIMKAGGCYMVMNTDLPSARFEYMLEESGCTHIITNIEAPDIALKSCQWIATEKLEEDSQQRRNIALPKIEKENLAYILYTSGSTGKPKGCMITHASLFNYIFWSTTYYFKNPEEGNWGLISPMSFDLSVTAVFTSLSRGKELHLGDEKKSIDQLLDECFRNPEIDTIKLTPTHVTILKDLAITNTNISLVICGGEQLKKSQIRTLKELNPQIRVYNEYGPTETTVGCIVTEVGVEDGKVLIGTPIANTQIRILDAGQKVLPIGTEGEIYISGAGVSKGYVNNPQLTSERFVTIGDTICYRTGDIGKWDYKGNIEYIGRIDDQVKIRGFRIEPDEIASQLCAFENVHDALVIVKGEDQNKKLVAYLSGDEKQDSATINSWLLERIPHYMIPTAYIWIDRFPLTPNGKIDKKNLPEPDLTANEKYVPPKNELQKQLTLIWAHILKIDVSKVGINSNFFNLGGNSLLAMKLKYAISRQLDTTLSLSQIFLMPTINQLADQLRVWKGKKEYEVIVPLNDESGKENIFIIHDGSGEIDGYFELVKNISKYKCYGLRLQESDTSNSMPSIANIASNYIHEIKTIQEKGSYRLIGWSLGGEIATEMTLQLEQSGEKVEDLIIIDSSLAFSKRAEKNPFTIKSEADILEAAFGYSIESQNNISSIHELWNGFLNSGLLDTTSVQKVRAVVPNEIKALIPDFLEKNSRELFYTVNKIRLLVNASENYFVKNSIHAKTLYIHPTGSQMIDNEQELKHFFKNLNIQKIAGDHFSIMKDPEVIALSDIINNQLELKLVEVSFS